ncbi:penicillin-binding protein 2B [Philodulcilactobacillus myokoensis]|uniref:Penicillin-binding protein 2B n=1 Tax=Philodulcilactobacillus myokoensis TaxID=2929573 RepID=A0A9W6B1W6_9LACO|nr:penicillin-binding transpeptidase domain-containing protein [Philodulcilactobacillus myokoensis]GLB47026.1 penicillin-binding protein 2B [Philodulcilactobacillus myokoensis]
MGPKVNRKIVGEGLFFIFAIIFIVMIGRFFYISTFKTVKGVSLTKMTRSLYTQTNVIKAQRGNIYDASGQPLAENTSNYSIYVVLNKQQHGLDGQPLYMTNKNKIAHVLSNNISISYRNALHILSPQNKDTFQVEFGNAGKNLSLTTKQKIESYHLNGVHFTKQDARLYPNGVFASNLIGLVTPETGKNGLTNLVGEMGLEREFNQELSGKNGFHQTDKNNSALDKTTPAKNGDNVYTTLDYRLQTLLENQMATVNNEAHPSNMNAVLMNAKTGKILAASQRPTFNAMTGKGIGSIWRNTIVQDLYEPGSTMKIFTMAASINSGHYNGNDIYQSGRYSVDGKIIPDWDPNGWGKITYNKGFALSSNVAMAHLEQQMSASTWMSYIKKFQFLQSTNSGIDNEPLGNVQFTYPIEQANTAFGQGIQVTVMQMMRALSAVANNGKMLKPRFVSKIVNSNTHQVIKNYPKEVVGTPISANTASEVRKHMEDVVYKPYGIGSDYKMTGYKVAAKTGTAQTSGSAGYESGNDSYLYSVAGMVPANNPKYVMYITMKKPVLPGNKTATQLMAEIFKPVMRRALQENSNYISNYELNTPNVISDQKNKAVNQLNHLGFKSIVIGKGQIITKQSINAKSKVKNGSRIILMTNGVSTVPNFNGWNEQSIKSYQKISNTNIKVIGHGSAYQQSVEPNKSILDNQQIVIKLKS